jgi:hypothetical protein
VLLTRRNAASTFGGSGKHPRPSTSHTQPAGKDKTHRRPTCRTGAGTQVGPGPPLARLELCVLFAPDDLDRTRWVANSAVPCRGGRARRQQPGRSGQPRRWRYGAGRSSSTDHLGFGEPAPRPSSIPVDRFEPSTWGRGANKDVMLGAVIFAQIQFCKSHRGVIKPFR